MHTLTPQTLKPPALPACEPKGGVRVSCPSWQVRSQRPTGLHFLSRQRQKSQQSLLPFVASALPVGAVLAEDRMKRKTLAVVAILQAQLALSGRASGSKAVAFSGLFACVRGRRGTGRSWHLLKSCSPQVTGPLDAEGLWQTDITSEPVV